MTTAISGTGLLGVLLTMIGVFMSAGTTNIGSTLCTYDDRVNARFGPRVIFARERVLRQPDAPDSGELAAAATWSLNARSDSALVRLRCREVLPQKRLTTSLDWLTTSRLARHSSVSRTARPRQFRLELPGPYQRTRPECSSPSDPAGPDSTQR